MALKILVAGVEKDERFAAETTVKETLGWRGLSESWTVSLVKMGGMWSVTLDGPDERFRGLSFVTSAERLVEAINEAIERKGGGSAPPPTATPVPAIEDAPRPAAPAAIPAPVPAVVPQATEPPASKTTVPPVAKTEAPPAASPSPSPAPATPTRTPAAKPAVAPGEHRDDHGCEHCQGPFVVVYEAQPGDTLQLVPVACPHCWKINLVEIGSWAASGRDYRADKV